MAQKEFIEVDGIPVARLSNLMNLSRVIIEDEFSDEEQYEAVGADPETLYPCIGLYEFLKRSTNDIHDTVKKPKILEVGCGTGGSIPLFGITHALEPNPFRADVAKEKYKDCDVRRGFAEALPYEDNFFDAVMMVEGFFQVRSDYEALMEFNRVLKKDGVLIINHHGDEVDLTFGRSLGRVNYTRILRDFGFDIIEVRDFIDYHHRFEQEITQTGYFMRKVKNFHYTDFRKMQLVPRDCKQINGKDTQLYEAKNYFPDGRDWQFK